MAKRRGTRLEVAKRLLDASAEDNDLDYLGRYNKRKRSKNDSNGQGSISDVQPEQPDDRTARITRREAAKLGQTRGVQGQTVSHRQTMQRQEEGDSEDQSGNAAEDDVEDDNDEDGGTDGIDHARITQAMNQARNRSTKPTINGIGSRKRAYRPQNPEASSDDGEGDQELLMSQPPDGEEVPVSRNANDRSRSRHGANRKTPQEKNQRSHNEQDKANTSPDESESEAESPSEMEGEIAEDTAFVEAPEKDEATATVKVVINSMGGILKTLQHPAWTGSTRWALGFASDNNDDGQKTCETSSGKVLMNEIQGLNDILEEATNPPEDSSEDDHDLAATTIAYLRTKSVDIQHYLTRIDEIVDGICSRKLSPVPRDASENFAAQVVKRRQALLRDLSRRLIPMLVITVKKACGICSPDNNRSKTTLYLDCFRLQFFLRPLAWAERLHRAFERGLKKWSWENELQDSKKTARSTLQLQLDALHSAVKKAEREMQQDATQAERQEREAETKLQERERNVERQRQIAAEKQREQDEQNRKDDERFRAFFRSTRALRGGPDPLKQLWEQSQAVLPDKFRATSTVRAAAGGSSSGQGQRTAAAVRPQGGPSRNATVGSVSDSDDPFSADYRPRSKTPVPNRHTSSNGVRQNPPSGLGSSRQARKAGRPWSKKEEKTMIRAIRYKGNYDVISMAQKLGRSEDDVARMAALLKQGYREAYTQRGAEIPGWAL